MIRSVFILVGSLALLTAATARADDVVEQHLSIKDHIFAPQQIDVPQGQKIKLVITNEDKTAAEFESFTLHREKVVGAQGTITVFIGPLDAGTYKFFDDFHRDTTTGSIVAK